MSREDRWPCTDKDNYLLQTSTVCITGTIPVSRGAKCSKDMLGTNRYCIEALFELSHPGSEDKFRPMPTPSWAPADVHVGRVCCNTCCAKRRLP